MFTPMRTAPPADERMLSVTEAAEILGISRRLAYYLVESGELPSVQYVTRRGKRAGVIRVRLSEVTKLIENREQPSA
jgi:excisionase family DNA binding protein